MPRKVFVAGEILTAADVNANLMDQAVMVFDDSTARGSAIPSPSEGMVTYLKDTNLVEAYTGAAFTPVGKILQVVSTTKTDSFSTTSTSMVDVTGVTVSITPTSTTSKVFISVHGLTSNNNDFLARFDLVRDSTAIGQGTGGSTSDQTTVSFPNSSLAAHNFSFEFLDSPSTTSSITYKLQMATSGATAFVGRLPSANTRSAITSITAMEVAG